MVGTQIGYWTRVRQLTSNRQAETAGYSWHIRPRINLDEKTTDWIQPTTSWLTDQLTDTWVELTRHSLHLSKNRWTDEMNGHLFSWAKWIAGVQRTHSIMADASKHLCSCLLLTSPTLLYACCLPSYPFAMLAKIPYIFMHSMILNVWSPRNMWSTFPKTFHPCMESVQRYAEVGTDSTWGWMGQVTSQIAIWLGQLGQSPCIKIYQAAKKQGLGINVPLCFTSPNRDSSPTDIWSDGFNQSPIVGTSIPTPAINIPFYWLVFLGIPRSWIIIIP